LKRFDLFWKVFYKLSPSACEAVQHWSRLRGAADSLRDGLAAEPAVSRKVEMVLASRDFWALQRAREITALLEEVAARRPRAVCEIGGANGGTLALFCQVAADDAILVSIDLAYTWPRRLACRRFARARQRVRCVRADSHLEDTRERLLRVLEGRRLDLLLVDGDHSFDGVRLDYEMYGPLVRPGGLIAFHDVVADHTGRFGRPTDAVAGEVPQFWETLRNATGARELIEDREQDGCGIGLLVAPGRPGGEA
jgi:predicted O-methyltransferase YrrM